MVASFISNSTIRAFFWVNSYSAFLLVVTVILDLSLGSMKKSIPSIRFSFVLPGEKNRRGSLGAISTSLVARTCSLSSSPFLVESRTLIPLSFSCTLYSTSWDRVAIRRVVAGLSFMVSKWISFTILSSIDTSVSPSAWGAFISIMRRNG